MKQTRFQVSKSDFQISSRHLDNPSPVLQTQAPKNTSMKRETPKERVLVVSAEAFALRSPTRGRRLEQRERC